MQIKQDLPFHSIVYSKLRKKSAICDVLLILTHRYLKVIIFFFLKGICPKGGPQMILSNQTPPFFTVVLYHFFTIFRAMCLYHSYIIDPTGSVFIQRGLFGQSVF